MIPYFEQRKKLVVVFNTCSSTVKPPPHYAGGIWKTEVFTLKTHQMFFVNTTPEELRTQQTPVKVKNDHRSKFSNLSNWKEEG